MGRKGKAAPASSAKALEVCGDASRLGVSAADVFAQFAAPPAGSFRSAAADDSEAAKVADAEISLALHALQKKDPTTRLRGVGELRELLAAKPTTALKEACVPFLHLYRRLWPQDAEPRVREGLQRCLQALIETLQRDFQKHLRSAFPTWLCAMFDTHSEVASAARRAFAASFSTDEKRRGVFRHCQTQCLDLIAASLHHSEQSLHDELGMTAPAAGGDRNLALERQDRYVRVIAASLNALGELVHVCAAPLPAGGPGAQTQLGAEELAPLLAVGSGCSPWSRLATKQPPIVRRAAADCLLRLLQSEAASPSLAPAASRAAAVNALADEAVPLAVAAGLLCSFARAGGSECWEGVNAAKSLWPPLLGALRRGGAGDTGLLARLPELLRALPAAAWGAERGEAVLQTLLEALQKPRAPAAAVWAGYFAVTLAAGAAGSLVGPGWRWAPLELYLGLRPGEAQGAVGASGQLPEPGNVPEAALAALPGALAPALPALLCARGEAAQELLAVLEAGAPMAPAALAAGDVARSWARWLPVLCALLRGGESSGPQSWPTEPAARLLASQARALLAALARAHRPQGGAPCELAEAMPLACALGELLTCREAQPEADWIPEGGAGQEPDEAWPAEARLLAWPLLPCWCGWLDAGCDVEALCKLGDRVVLPLLREAVKRHGASFPSDEVRDLVLARLLVPPGESADGAGGAVRLSAAVQLAFQCLPRDLQVATAPSLQEAAASLADLVAEGAAEGERALLLALQPGCLAEAEACGCLDRLVQALRQADRSSAGALRLALLCSSALGSLSKGSEEGAPGLSALRGPVCEALLGVLVQGEGEGCGLEQEATAFSLLPRVLRGVGSAVVSGALGVPPASAAVRPRWARLLVEAAAAAAVPAASLLCECRGGFEALRPEGSVAPAQLLRGALGTQEVLHACGAGAFGSLEGPPECAVFALLWELLLASAVLGKMNSDLEDLVWSWLEAASAAAQGRFLLYCAVQAAGEGDSWTLEPEESACSASRADAGPLPLSTACLHGLAPLRHALRRSLRAAAAQSAGPRELLRWALQDARGDHAASPAWGHVAAAVIGHISALSTSDEFAAGGVAAQAARASWRVTLHSEAEAKGLTAPLLHAAAAVERWAAPVGGATAESAVSALSRDARGSFEASTQPVIVEAGQGAEAQDGQQPQPAEAAEEIDTALLDTHERLLRWAQGSGARLEVLRADAFAEYAAATWPSLSALGPGESAGASGREATRLRRLVVELLQASQGGAVPGALHLVGALCRGGAWPETVWPAAMQATADVDKLAAAAAGTHCEQGDGLPPSRAFVDDALEAAVALLPLAPAACAARVVSLLGAHSPQLQLAAAARLRAQPWVPQDRGALPPGRPADVLQKLEAMLLDAEEGEAGETAPSAGGPSASGEPSCSDIIHEVLGAVVGAELQQELWAVDGALASFLDWETMEAEGGSMEDSGSEAEVGVAAAESPSRARAAGSASSRREAAASASASGPEELPADCRRAVFAALAAWELLLLGLQPNPARPLEASRAGGGGGAGEGSVAAVPSELVASALQLTPDQLAGAPGCASAFAAGPAPPLEGGWSPIQPLLRLLFHALACPRLVGESGVEARVKEALSQEGDAAAPAAAPAASALPNSDILALASRVLLLALQAMPGAVRAFWEALPRRRDRDLVERLVTRSFSSLLAQSEAAAAAALLDAQKDRLDEVEASVARRPRQLALQLTRDELRAELLVQIPDAFPLRPAVAEIPEKMPGIPRPRVRNWMLQARQVLVGPRPMVVGRVMLMWARSFALFFEGVEDCPICYNVVHLSTQTIPRKACPTCKHKFHSECLYHWFKTSAKTTCPLCSQPF